MKGINPWKNTLICAFNCVYNCSVFARLRYHKNKIFRNHTVRKYQKNIPFVFKNNIHLSASDADKDEKSSIKSKLNTQLDDSAKVNVKDKFFILHSITSPPVFDTNAVAQSASNMMTSLRNLGYYNPQVTYAFDTVIKKNGDQKRVIIDYEVVSGKRTLVDTLAYLFDKPELEQLAISTKKESLLQPNSPIQKAPYKRKRTGS